MFVPFAGRSESNIAKVSTNPYSKPGRDQLVPVGRKHYNCIVDPKAHTTHRCIYDSIEEIDRMCIHDEDKPTILLQTADKGDQDVLYNELVFRDSELGRSVVTKRKLGTDHTHTCTQSVVISNTNNYCIRANEDDKPESLLSMYSFIREQLRKERKLSFAGVAFGDIALADIGVRSSGRLAVNMAGLNTVYADVPIRTGEPVVADFARMNKHHSLGVDSVHREGTPASKKQLVVYPLHMAVLHGMFTTKNVSDHSLLPWNFGICVRGSNQGGKHIDVKLTPPARFDTSCSMSVIKPNVAQKVQVAEHINNRDGLHEIGAVRMNTVYDFRTQSRCSKTASAPSDSIFHWPVSSISDTVYDVVKRELLFSHIISGKSCFASEMSNSSRFGSENPINVLSAFNGDYLCVDDFALLFDVVPEMKLLLRLLLIELETGSAEQNKQLVNLFPNSSY
jgi:hypothetical protein